MEGAGGYVPEKTPDDERRDKFDQMDGFDQLLFELNTPIDDITGELLDYLEEGRRRIEVIAELIEIGDLRAVEPLIKAAEKKGSEGRWRAIEALGELGDNRAVKALVEALEDKEVRESAAYALDELGWDPDD